MNRLSIGNDFHERTQKLAYQYWLDRGRPFGSSEIDWFAAEKSLSESDAAASACFSLYELALEPNEYGPQPACNP